MAIPLIEPRINAANFELCSQKVCLLASFSLVMGKKHIPAVCASCLAHGILVEYARKLPNLLSHAKIIHRGKISKTRVKYYSKSNCQGSTNINVKETIDR